MLLSLGKHLYFNRYAVQQTNTAKFADPRRVHKWKAFAASTMQVFMLSMVYGAISTGQISTTSHTTQTSAQERCTQLPASSACRGAFCACDV